jgi:lipopolysaccharide/colanic/teichoic acid biosynthesis glycosyltransferase
MSLTSRLRAPARHRGEVRPGYRAVGPARRALDIVVAAVMLVVLLPLIAVIAGLILLTSGRPVFFSQSRVGEHGRRFVLYKLRTMRVVASGPEVTAQADARITRLGAFLRRTAIDELPQLWHVLRGQMTLVGPRPESDALARRYPSSCRSVLMARPGLTGPAQLHYRERSAVPPADWPDVESYYLEVLVPLRVAADREYLDRPTVGRTLHYLALTALFVTGAADLQRPVQRIPAHASPSPLNDDKAARASSAAGR